MDAPAVRFAKNGDVRIAYQVVGDGPVDLLVIHSFVSRLDTAWGVPEIANFQEWLASFSRLILFDKRGTGLSDPLTDDTTLEDRVDDIRAVLDAAGSDRTALFGSSEGATLCAVFAASHPERVTHLILHSPFIVGEADDECPWAWDDEWWDFYLAAFGEIEGPEDLLDGIRLPAPTLAANPEKANEVIQFWATASSPAVARTLLNMNRQIDVRPILPTVQAPTLVIHPAEEVYINPEYGRYAAQRIPGARLVELEGEADHFPWLHANAVIGEIEEFITGTRHRPPADRIFATVVLTDIVDSTSRAIELGDNRWRGVLDGLDADVHDLAQRFRGTVVKATGDGHLLTFDGPGRAARCAGAIRDAAGQRDLTVRIGIHAGEVEARDGDVAGVGVHLAARVMAFAGPGEILTSSTIKDLVFGSGLEFADRGTHELKGVPGEWQLFEVVG